MNKLKSHFNEILGNTRDINYKDIAKQLNENDKFLNSMIVSSLFVMTAEKTSMKTLLTMMETLLLLPFVREKDLEREILELSEYHLNDIFETENRKEFQLKRYQKLNDLKFLGTKSKLILKDFLDYLEDANRSSITKKEREAFKKLKVIF